MSWARLTKKSGTRKVVIKIVNGDLLSIIEYKVSASVSIFNFSLYS